MSHGTDRWTDGLHEGWNMCTCLFTDAFFFFPLRVKMTADIKQYVRSVNTAGHVVLDWKMHWHSDRQLSPLRWGANNRSRETGRFLNHGQTTRTSATLPSYVNELWLIVVFNVINISDYCRGNWKGDRRDSAICDDEKSWGNNLTQRGLVPCMCVFSKSTLCNNNT